MQFSVKKGEISETKGDLLVVNVFEEQKELKGAALSVDKVMGGAISAAVKDDHFEGKLGTTLLVRPGAKLSFKRVLLVGLGKKKNFDEEKIRHVSAVSFNEAKKLQVKKIVSILHGAGKGGLPAKLCAKTAVEGAALAAYDFNKYKTEKKNKVPEIFELVTHNLRHVREAEKGTALGEFFSRATVLARDLVDEPASHMSPLDLVNAAKKVAAASKGKIKIRIFDQAALERMGAGGILAVGKGSHCPPFLVDMIYQPGGAGKCLALVGKALCFDSGGLCLKPRDGMRTMKCDMAGAAAVIGVFSVLPELKVKTEIHGLFAPCENMPAGNAVKTGDIVRTLSKKTVEIYDTDAEGRVTLADVLTYALRQEPDAIIDLATLTGSIMSTLGEEIAGLMTNKPELGQRILKAAKMAGEKIWELPLEESYHESIKSEVADVCNVGYKLGGPITAALILREFVDNTPWVHLDIAGPAYATRPFGPYTRGGGTGFGVRTILEYLID
jgi:leucyl aminopeptidase